MLGKRTNAYLDGFQSGREDWRIIGPPHARRANTQSNCDKAAEWALGRCHGFMEAQDLLEKERKKNRNEK